MSRKEPYRMADRNQRAEPPPDADGSSTQLEQHPGLLLLNSLATRSGPLSNTEVDVVVEYLEASTTAQHLTYRSRDLGIGIERVRTGRLIASGDCQSDPVSAAAEHFETDIQDAAFEFVKSDARIEKHLSSTRPWIRIASIKRFFYHHQLYAAFYLVLKERGPRRGAIEADLMGLGKTTTAYLYIIFNYLLSENALDIRRSPEHHCPPSSQSWSQPADAVCPSGGKWPIVCACQEHGVTYRLGLVPRPGGSLVIVPASLLGNWKREWKELACNELRKLALYIQHQSFPDRLLPRKLCKRLKLVWNEATATATTAEEDISHRIIILTSVESYSTQVLEYIGAARRYELSVAKVNKADKNDLAGLTDGLAWGRVVRDEAQLTTNYDTRVYGILRSLANNGWTAPNFLALTATPMLRNGVADIVACIRIINLISPNISQDKACQPFTSTAQLDQLVKMHRDQRTIQNVGKKTVTESLGDKVGKLLAAYCIRRRSDSFQNGKVLVAIPPLVRYDVMCPSPVPTFGVPIAKLEGMLKSEVDIVVQSALIKNVRSMAQGNPSGDAYLEIRTLLDNSVLSRILASVPGIVRYGVRQELRWNNIEAHEWHILPQKSPVYTDMEELEASSGKLHQLRIMLEALKDCVDAQGRPEKLVIVSEFPFICHVVQCFCLKVGWSAQWMHSALDPAERSDMAKVFQGGRVSSAASSSKPPSRILIGATCIIGQGLTLTAAHRIILMEPSQHAAVEDQIYDRVHRLTSVTDRCWAYRLINPESEIEKLIVKSQTSQQQLEYLAEWCNIDCTSTDELLDIIDEIKAESDDEDTL